MSSIPIHVDMSLSNFSVLKGFNEFIKTVIQLTVSHGPRPLTAPTGADLISSNPGRGSLQGGDLKGRSRKGMDLAKPEPPFSLLLRREESRRCTIRRSSTQWSGGRGVEVAFGGAES